MSPTTPTTPGDYQRPPPALFRPSPSISRRVHDEATRLEVPLGIAFALWVCCLPLVAVIAVTFLDLGAGLALAGATLVAWVALCVWAFRTPASP